MEFIIERGSEKDIDGLAQLYDNLNDSLAAGNNYPGWKKGIYPVRENAEDGVANKTLYVARENGKIVGTVILNHEPEAAYHTAEWGMKADYADVFVVHTFAVHPANSGRGIGKRLLDFAQQLAAETNMKAIRLDVFEKNVPAIRLYEKCGFRYVDTVDLGLSNFGLDWFRLYEKIL